MLISISGSQGSGKSTILNELKTKGYNVIERKTSRSILTDWNVSLEEVNTNPELTIKFQEEILKRKYADDSSAAFSSETWFTERTFIDLLVYATISLGKENHHAEWLDEYCQKCLRYAKEMYHYNFYIGAGQFKVQSDGVRGYSEFYSKLVDYSMFSFYKENIDSSKLTVINIQDINDRVSMVIKRLLELKVLTPNDVLFNGIIYRSTP